MKRKRGSGNSIQAMNNVVNRYMRRRAEHKFFDSTVSETIGTTFDVNAITQPIIQGIGGGQRTGDNITYLDLTMVYRIDINSSATTTDIRLVVVLDKQNNGVAPISSDLFVNSGLTATYSAQQIKAKRFTILLDEIYNVTAGGIAAITKKKVIPLNATAAYLGTTDAAASNGKNSMWMFSVSTDNTNKPGFNMDYQVRFVDF